MLKFFDGAEECLQVGGGEGVSPTRGVPSVRFDDWTSLIFFGKRKPGGAHG